MAEKMKRTDADGNVWFKEKTENGVDVWRRENNGWVIKTVPAGSWDPEN